MKKEKLSFAWKLEDMELLRECKVKEISEHRYNELRTDKKEEILDRFTGGKITEIKETIAEFAEHYQKVFGIRKHQRFSDDDLEYAKNWFLEHNSSHLFKKLEFNWGFCFDIYSDKTHKNIFSINKTEIEREGYKISDLPCIFSIWYGINLKGIKKYEWSRFIEKSFVQLLQELWFREYEYCIKHNEYEKAKDEVFKNPYSKLFLGDYHTKWSGGSYYGDVYHGKGNPYEDEDDFFENKENKDEKFTLEELKEVLKAAKKVEAQTNRLRSEISFLKDYKTKEGIEEIVNISITKMKKGYLSYV